MKTITDFEQICNPSVMNSNEEKSLWKLSCFLLSGREFEMKYLKKIHIILDWRPTTKFYCNSYNYVIARVDFISKNISFPKAIFPYCVSFLMIPFCGWPQICIFLEITDKIRLLTAFYLQNSLRSGPLKLWKFWRIYVWETKFSNTTFSKSGFLKPPTSCLI